MRYLITGGTGFVGSHMIDFLLKHEEDAIIYVLKRWRSPEDNISHLYDNNRVNFLEVDLLDKISVANALKYSTPNVVYHFASQSFPQASFIYPSHTLTTNIIGTLNLLDEIKNVRDEGLCDPIIINVSSSEVYGMPLESEIPIKEINPLRAANPYSISKVGQDMIGSYYYKAFGLKVITTRMFSHEGSRRGRHFALSSFAYQIAIHEKKFKTFKEEFKRYVIKVGNLQSIRTYAHVEDAIEAYYLCKERGKIGEVYNIGGKETCSVCDALERLLLKSIIPRDQLTIVEDPGRIRPTDITLQIPDCSKFISHTDWFPKKGVEEIVEDLLNYWRKNV